jgi:hypothetical protein
MDTAIVRTILPLGKEEVHMNRPAWWVDVKDMKVRHGAVKEISGDSATVQEAGDKRTAVRS